MFSPLFSLILMFGDLQVDAEVADNRVTQTKGLMGRSSLGENEGMLFVYEKPQPLFFWMKNTRIPLSIGFFDSEKRLLQVEEMEPPQNDSPIIPQCQSTLPAKYALEMPKGWYKKNNIFIGSKFTLHNSQ